MQTTFRGRLADFFRREWLPCVLVLVLLGLNLFALDYLGATHNLHSDDFSYLSSGVTLANTGMYTMHDPIVPSAQAMPALSAIIALFSLVFGEGTLLMLALKLFWCGMGAMVGWFVYHSVRLYAPAWCAVVATLVLARTDFLWCNNLILTETPTMLCFSIVVYATLQLGRTGKGRYFWMGGLALFAAMLFRGNMAVNIIFLVIYLLAVGYAPKRLLKQALALFLVMLCFFVPWIVRNYIQFKAIVPFNYGAGNPVLLGTYQGVGWPEDEELDYETNVDEVMPEKYAAYYEADGSVPYRYLKYLQLEQDSVKASYRQREWLNRDPAGFFLSYLVLKPWEIIKGVFYWEQVWEIPHQVLKDLQLIMLGLCVLGLAAALARKKNRAQLIFLGGAYLGDVLFYSMGFALDRYNVAVMPAVCVFLGIGLGALAEVGQDIGRRLKLQTP